MGALISQTSGQNLTTNPHFFSAQPVTETRWDQFRAELLPSLLLPGSDTQAAFIMEIQSLTHY